MVEIFDDLMAVNVTGHIEKKKSGNTMLSYLSWAFAWAEVKKRYSDASYHIERDPETQLPYVFDARTGYMVFTSVTIGDMTHEMWLPVMDSHNAAMKNEPYTVKTKFSEYTVAAATMFDINKTIMRCLTKNLAMFGLGLYIYAGEDLPISDSSEEEKPLTATEIATLKGLCKKKGYDIVKVFPGGIENLTPAQYTQAITKLK